MPQKMLNTAPRNQAIVTGNSTLPGFFIYLGCPHRQEAMVGEYIQCLKNPNYSLSYKMLWASWEHQQSEVLPGICQVRETMGLGNWWDQSKGVEQGFIFCRHSHNSVVTILQLSRSLRSYELGFSVMF